MKTNKWVSRFYHTKTWLILNTVIERVNIIVDKSYLGTFFPELSAGLKIRQSFHQLNGYLSTQTTTIEGK